MKTTVKNLLRLSLVAAMLLAGVKSAKATLYLDETFVTYTTDQPVGGQGSWTTHITNVAATNANSAPLNVPPTKADVLVKAPALEKTPYISSGIGQYVSIDYAGVSGYDGAATGTPKSASTSVLANRVFAGTAISGAGSVVYLACLINHPTTATSGMGLVGIAEKSNGNQRARIWVKKGSANSKIKFGVTRNSATLADTAWAANEYDNTQTYLVVLKYTIDGTAQIFVNPTPGESEPTTADATSRDGGAGATKVNTVFFRANGSGTFNYYVGGIRIASTWAEAVASGAVDTDAPILAGKDSIQPLGNNIATSTEEFVLKFNENVKAGTGYALLYKSDDTHVDSLDIATATINGKNVTFTLNAGKQLTTATSYYLKVDADAITDMAGNKFAGINDKTTWTFTTSASLSNEKKLTALTIKGQRGNTRYSNDSVFISVPPTAKMDSLVVAGIEISDAATDSVAGKHVAKDSVIDCSADVAIKITAQNGSDTTYWLRVSNAPDTQNELLTFRIGSTTGVIRNDSVLVTLPASTTDLTALVATFTKSQYATVHVGSKDSLQTSGTTANDFTNTVIYKVKSEAGANHEYKVVVSIAAKQKGLIYEDNFATGYIVGQKLNGQNDWFADGTPDSVMKVVATKLDYASYAPAGVSNSVNVNYPTISGGSVVLAKALPNSISTDTIYMSCMVKVTESQTGTGFIGFYETAPSSQRSRIWFKRNGANAASSTGVHFGVTRNSGTAANADYETTPTLVPYGTTALLVLKQIFVPGASNDIVQIFINPTPGATEPTPNVTATNSSTGADPAQLDGIYIRANGSNSLKFMVAGIRVATSWAEAVKYGEPAGAPTVETYTPAVGATDANYTVNPTLKFNKAVKAGTGNIVIKNYATDAALGTYNVTNSAQVGFDGQTVTIKAAPLSKGKMYVSIPSGAIVANSNAADVYAGTADKDTWAFTAPQSTACNMDTFTIASPSTPGLVYKAAFVAGKDSAYISTNEVLTQTNIDGAHIVVSAFASAAITTNSYNFVTGNGVITYTVTAEDGTTTKNYKIEFHNAPASDFVAYSIGSAIGKINKTSKVITVSLPSNTTDRSALVATFELSPAATAKVGSTAQVSEVTPNNFNDTVRYTVTASDNTTSEWKVFAAPMPEGLLLTENFLYPSNMLLKDVPNSQWKELASGSTTYLKTSDKKLNYEYYIATTDDSSKSVKYSWTSGSLSSSQRELSIVDITAGKVYMSFMMRPGVSTAGSGVDILGFASTTTSTGGQTRVYLRRNGDGKNPNCNIGLGKNHGSVANVPAWTSAKDTSATYLVVLKYDFGTGYASLYINPVPGKAEPAVADLRDNTISSTTGAPVDITSIRSIVMRTNGNNPVQATIGGIRVATTWEDAVKMGSNVTETGSNITDYILSTPDQSASWMGSIDNNNSKVNVTVAKSVNLATQPLVADFTLSEFAEAFVGDSLQESGVTAHLFANIVLYEVVPKVGTTKQWTITVVNQGGGTAVEVNPMNISIYPNPVVDNLNFSANEDLALVQVYTTLGTLVQEQVNPGNVVNLGKLAKGIYLVKFVGQSGKTTTVQIIK